jgi:esterase/lipase superfamily enzyme
MRFIETDTPSEHFQRASPLYFMQHMGGAHLDLLRTRHIHIATGEGRWESLQESWKLANALGRRGVPNHVDSWGPDWHHDWMTWRVMLPKYLAEWTADAP